MSLSEQIFDLSAKLKLYISASFFPRAEIVWANALYRFRDRQWSGSFGQNVLELSASSGAPLCVQAFCPAANLFDKGRGCPLEDRTPSRRTGIGGTMFTCFRPLHQRPPEDVQQTAPLQRQSDHGGSVMAGATVVLRTESMVPLPGPPQRTPSAGGAPNQAFIHIKATRMEFLRTALRKSVSDKVADSILAALRPSSTRQSHLKTFQSFQ